MDKRVVLGCGTAVLSFVAASGGGHFVLAPQVAPCGALDTRGNFGRFDGLLGFGYNRVHARLPGYGFARFWPDARRGPRNGGNRPDGHAGQGCGRVAKVVAWPPRMDLPCHHREHLVPHSR